MAECTHLLKLIDAYALIVGKAQDILSEHVAPDGPPADDVIDELIGLLSGPEWRDVEHMQIQLTGRMPRSARVAGGPAWQIDLEQQLELALGGERRVIQRGAPAQAAAGSR